MKFSIKDLFSVTKSAGNCGLGQIYLLEKSSIGNFIFYPVWALTLVKSSLRKYFINL